MPGERRDGGRARRRAATGIGTAVVAAGVTALPLLVAGWPADGRGQVGAGCAVLGAAVLGWWRHRPLLACLVGPALLLVPAVLGTDLPDIALVVLLAFAAVAAERFGGPAAWLVAAGVVGYLVAVYALTGDDSPGVVILVLPGYLAGTALRLRRHTAEQLAERGRELERERERHAAVAVANERARIAAELHDIVGHAVSVMVVQAMAGQRLVDREPGAARAALDAVGDAARRGRADLEQLVRLLGGDVAPPDLRLVEEVVATAARTGIPVTCRLALDVGGPPDPVAAHLAFRVVQEGLTNALRHAPGAAVRVSLTREPGDGGLLVRVENDRAPDEAGPGLVGTSRGLAGLRDRVVAHGGSFEAVPTAAGGWCTEARFASRRPGVPAAHPGRPLPPGVNAR